MKTAFGILARDLKLLLRNPVALLVIVAVLVLPGLYAWYCIIANWDPYSNTGDVPVAIVNEDLGTESELTGKVEIGKQVVEQLHENDSIDWRFYDDRESALDATRRGEVYATIVFPETLSADIVGIISGSTKEPTIYFYPNEKRNAVAVKVCNSVVQTLTREINQGFASRVNETVLSKVQEGVEGAGEIVDATKSDARSEVAGAQDEIASVLASLDEASSTIAGWRTAVAGGQESLSAAAAEMPTIRDGLNAASQDLITLQQQTAEFDSNFSRALLNTNSQLSKLSAQTSARVASASADVVKLSGEMKALIEQLRSFRDAIEAIAELLPEDLSAELLAIDAELDEKLVRLEQFSDTVANAAEDASYQASSLNDTIQEAIAATDAASNTFSTEILPKLSAGTDSMASALSGLASALGQFEPQITQLQGVLSQADVALGRADESIAQAKGLLSQVSVNLQATTTDLGAMGSALEVDKVSRLLGIDPDNVGQFMSSPVKLVTEKIYPVSNYGTAVSPFYTNLALWVGCFILITLIRLEVDRRGFEQATPTQRYFGRWLLLVMLALIQSQVICGVDILLGIDCANPAVFMASGAIASFCYMNLIYALALTFRNIGKTLCILLLIMQVPGSSGMYPIEMMPGFFRAIHPFLPFTYSIDAMREALCGMYGTAIVGDWVIMLTLVPVSLLLGLVIRPYLLNLTQMFDQELGKAGFFAAEEHGQGRDSERTRALLRSLSRQDALRDEVESRAWQFNRRYPKLRRAGSIMTFAIPFVLLALMLPLNIGLGLSTDAKLIALFVMVIILLLVFFGLILLEYMHQTIVRETRLLGQELMGEAFADGAFGEVAAPVVVPQPVNGPKHAKPAEEPLKRFGASREIFRTDMRMGFASAIGVVVIMLLVITPSLYAWFNLAGSWDPYSNTGGLKVAVASEDEGYKGDLLPLTVNVGDTIVSQLRGNDSFDWQFVSRDKAVSGIEAGEYYAAIVIPENFSKNMLTYLVDDADYPDVIYYTNEKENPIAPLITQKGADSIQESIRVSFTEKVDEVGLSVATDVMEYLSQPQVGNYAMKMGGHLDDAVGDLQAAASEMRSIADLSSLTAGVITTAGTTMDGMLSVAAACRASLAEAQNGVSSATAAFDEASALIEQAITQSESGLEQITANADAALGELESAVAGTPEEIWELQARVESWSQALSGVEARLEEIAQDESLTPEERQELEALAKRVGSVANTLSEMATVLGKVAQDAEAAPGEIEWVRSELWTLLAEAEAGEEEARAYYEQGVKAPLDNLGATLNSVVGSTNTILDGIETTISGLSASTSGLSAQLTSLADDLNGAAARLDSASSRVIGAKDRVNEALSSGDATKMADLLMGDDAGTLAARLATPVNQHTEAIYPVANFGSQMASFYTVLSLWVGALVLVSTMKVHLTPERSEELRRRFRLKPRHEYLGRLGIFAFIGLLQALLVSLGDLCLLHIQCLHPVLFVLECVFIGQVFCLIVYTFTELFGDIGKAICVILLIMQVAASGGTFPIEMLDNVFFEVAPYLPFYHGMSALQGCVGGIYQSDSFVYLSFMLVYVLIMLLIGVVARKPFRFVTDWLEEQLEKTNYM